MSCLKDTCTAFIADLVAWQLYFSAGPRVGQYTPHYRMEKLEEMTKSLKSMEHFDMCITHGSNARIPTIVELRIIIMLFTALSHASICSYAFTLLSCVTCQGLVPGNEAKYTSPYSSSSPSLACYGSHPVLLPLQQLCWMCACVYVQAVNQSMSM